MNCRYTLAVVSWRERKHWICGWPIHDGKKACDSRHRNRWRWLKSELHDFRTYKP